MIHFLCLIPSCVVCARRRVDIPFDAEIHTSDDCHAHEAYFAWRQQVEGEDLFAPIIVRGPGAPALMEEIPPIPLDQQIRLLCLEHAVKAAEHGLPGSISETAACWEKFILGVEPDATDPS